MLRGMNGLEHRSDSGGRLLTGLFWSSILFYGHRFWVSSGVVAGLGSAIGPSVLALGRSHMHEMSPIHVCHI